MSIFQGISSTLLSSMCYDHSVNSRGLAAQSSHFLFLSVHDPKTSTLERIAKIFAISANFCTFASHKYRDKYSYKYRDKYSYKYRYK